MTKILEFIITLILLYVLLRAIRGILLRTLLFVRLHRLSRNTGATLRLHGFPFRSFFALSATPEITLRTDDTVYLIRTYNGGGLGRTVHFASPRFTVRFSRLRTASYKLTRRQGTEVSVTHGGFGVGAKVRILPDLRVPTEISSSSYKLVPVMIFNPAPGEVSFVTEERTSIDSAYTGDSIYGTLIFTADTFSNYVDREIRRAKANAVGEKIRR